MTIRFGLLPPQEAIDFFRQKGYRIGFDHRDVWQQEHQAGFTVAKAMQMDLLVDIRAQVDAALANGSTLATFVEQLRPNLVKRGWWGQQLMTDPVTGETKEVQLGSPNRLRVIYNTNLRTAHAEGQWERIQEAKATLPYVMYDHTPSEHERPEHKAWDGLVLLVDDPWVAIHYPVKAWGCHCRFIQLGQRQLDRLGLQVGTAPETQYVSWTNKRTGEIEQVPAGVDPAFNYPPGGRLANLGKALADKVEQAPAALGAAVFKQAAPASMPQLMQGYTAWVNAIEGGGSKSLSGRRVVGAVSPGVVSGAEAAGVPLASAGLSVEQHDIAGLLADESTGIDRAWIYALPERLGKPDAVILDAGPGSALWYIWKSGDRYVRMIVRTNTPLKGNAYTNAIGGAQNVERSDLQGGHLKMIEGGL